MIRVQRGPQPESFTERARTWMNRFQEELKRNPELAVTQFWSRIRPQLRQDAEVLYRTAHGKCAFCESVMAHVSAPHIEHYRPKQKFPDLVFAWNNWLLSCGRCNDTKWAHFPDCGGQPCLIDPASEDPALHIEFCGYIPVSKTRRGEITIKLIGLDRSPLEEERSRWLTGINVLLLLCLSPEFRAEAREMLIWTMQDDAPYAAMTRCYLRQKAPRLANLVRLHPHVSPQDPIGRIQRLTDDYAARLEVLE